MLGSCVLFIGVFARLLFRFFYFAVFKDTSAGEKLLAWKAYQFLLNVDENGEDLDAVRKPKNNAKN